MLRTSDNFFAHLGTDHTYVNSYTLTFSPTSSLDGHRLTYEIPKMAVGNCLFLSDLMIAMNLRLVDFEGKKPPDGATVAPVNAFPMTMIRQARLFLNDVEVSSSDHGAYAWRAYTSLTLNYGLQERHGWLEMLGYYADSEGAFQETDLMGGGFYHRADLFSTADDEGKNRVYFDHPTPMYSKVFTDFVGCDLPLVSGVAARLEFSLHEPSFYMQCPVSGKKV